MQRRRISLCLVCSSCAFISVELKLIDMCTGPFWICVTLVFSVAIGGNLSTFLTERGNPSYHYRPQFHRGQSHPDQQLLVCSSGAESGSSLSTSDDSCRRHLPVCLAGPILPMGFPDLAAGGREADWRLLLSGDRVRLWLLALYLHSHFSESVNTEVKYSNSECQKPSFVISSSAGFLDHSV